MPYKREKNFLELNDEYHIMYYQFLKDSRIWNNTGQYWLGNESMKRAVSLLNGDIEEALKPIKSEVLYLN